MIRKLFILVMLLMTPLSYAMEVESVLKLEGNNVVEVKEGIEGNSGQLEKDEKKQKIYFVKHSIRPTICTAFGELGYTWRCVKRFCREKISAQRMLNLDDVPDEVLAQVLQYVIAGTKSMEKINSYFLVSHRFNDLRPLVMNKILPEKIKVIDQKKREMVAFAKQQLITSLGKHPFDCEITYIEAISSFNDMSLLLLALAANGAVDNELNNNIFSEAHEENVIKILLKYGANPDVEQGKMSALMHAARTGKFDLIKALLEYGADANMKNSNGLHASDYADISNMKPEFLSQRVALCYIEIYDLLKRHENKSNSV